MQTFPLLNELPTNPRAGSYALITPHSGGRSASLENYFSRTTAYQALLLRPTPSTTRIP